MLAKFPAKFRNEPYRLIGLAVFGLFATAFALVIAIAVAMRPISPAYGGLFWAFITVLMWPGAVGALIAFAPRWLLVHMLTVNFDFVGDAFAVLLTRLVHGALFSLLAGLGLAVGSLLAIYGTLLGAGEVVFVGYLMFGVAIAQCIFAARAYPIVFIPGVMMLAVTQMLATATLHVTNPYEMLAARILVLMPLLGFAAFVIALVMMPNVTEKLTPRAVVRIALPAALYLVMRLIDLVTVPSGPAGLYVMLAYATLYAAIIIAMMMGGGQAVWLLLAWFGERAVTLIKRHTPRPPTPQEA